MTGEGGGGGDVMGGGDSKSGGGEKGGGGGDLMDCDPAQLCCNPLGPLFGGK